MINMVEIVITFIILMKDILPSYLRYREGSTLGAGTCDAGRAIEAFEHRRDC